MALSPDGLRLALASNKSIVIWDLGKQRLLERLLGHVAPIHALAWNESSLYSATAVGVVRRWDLGHSHFEMSVGHTSRVLGRWPLVGPTRDGRVNSGRTRDRSLTFCKAGLLLSLP